MLDLPIKTELQCCISAQVLCCGSPQSLSYSSLFDFNNILTFCLPSFVSPVSCWLALSGVFKVFVCYLLSLPALCCSSHAFIPAFFSVFSSSSLMFPSALKLCFAGAWTGKNDCCHILLFKVLYFTRRIGLMLPVHCTLEVGDTNQVSFTTDAQLQTRKCNIFLQFQSFTIILSGHT